MARVKRGTKRIAKRKKILDRASGYYGTKSKSHRMAKLAVESDEADKVQDAAAAERYERLHPEQGFQPKFL